MWKVTTLLPKSSMLRSTQFGQLFTFIKPNDRVILVCSFHPLLFNIISYSSSSFKLITSRLYFPFSKVIKLCVESLSVQIREWCDTVAGEGECNLRRYILDRRNLLKNQKEISLKQSINTFLIGLQKSLLIYKNNRQAFNLGLYTYLLNQFNAA